MEDELDQQESEEEISEPPKSNPKRIILKSILFSTMILIAVYLVFFGPLSFFLGDEPGFDQDQSVMANPVNTEYDTEYTVPEFILSIVDESGQRIKQLVINVAFETTGKTIKALEKRIALTEHTITNQIEKFEFLQLIQPDIRDSLRIRIKNEMNSILPPDKNIMIKQVFLNIVTM